MYPLFTAEQALAFPPPNYDNPKTRGNALTVVDSVFLAVALIFLLLRLYTRLFVRKWFGWDDVFICLAFVCVIGLNAIIFLGMQKCGWARHVYDIPISTASMSIQLAYSGKILYLATSMFTAYALLAFYYRLIAESGSHWFRMTLHVVLTLNVVAWTTFIFLEIFICQPVTFYWSLTGPEGAYCHNEGPITLSAGIIKVFIDFIITTLPLPLILRTEMRPRQRYMVSALFGLGYVVTGAGVARVYYTHKLFYTDGDLSWWQYPTFLSSTIENDLAIVCACAPTIRPLFPKFFGGPLIKLKDWISTRSPSSNTSKQLSDPANPKRASNITRSSNITQLGTHIRSFGFTRSTQSAEEEGNDELELVIQKNNGHVEAGPVQSDNESGFHFELHEEQKPESEVNVRAMKSMSSGTIGTGTAYINPFDPRLDVEDQSFHAK